MPQIGDFDAQVQDPAAPMAVALVPGSRALLVAFGGIIGALGIPPFEFFNLTKGFALSRVYVRDLDQAWYHAGLRGVSSSAAETAEVLRTLVAESGAERVVLVGNSMGGYAALLFGALLGADVVHAFSPQTFVDRASRSMHGDRRWSAQLEPVHRANPPHLDLLPLLRDRDGDGQMIVHYSPADALDTIHAERLRGLPRVELRRHADGGHNVIKHLRQSGALDAIVRGALSTG